MKGYMKYIGIPSKYSEKDFEIINRMISKLEYYHKQRQNDHKNTGFTKSIILGFIVWCDLQLDKEENINKYKNLPIINCSHIRVGF